MILKILLFVAMFSSSLFAQTTRPMKVVFGAYLRGDQRALMEADKVYVPWNSPLEIDIFAQQDQNADAVAKYAKFLRISKQSPTVWHISNKGEPLSFELPTIQNYVQINLAYAGRIRALEPGVLLGAYNEPRPFKHFSPDKTVWNAVLPLWNTLDVLHFPNYIGPGEGTTLEQFKKTYTERAIEGKRWLDTVDGMRIFRGRIKMISFNLQKNTGNPNFPELYESDKIEAALNISKALEFDVLELYAYCSFNAPWGKEAEWYRTVVTWIGHNQ